MVPSRIVPLTNVRLARPRYDSISTFIYNCRTGPNRCDVVDKYNDIDCPVDEPSRQALMQQGIDAVSQLPDCYPETHALLPAEASLLSATDVTLPFEM